MLTSIAGSVLVGSPSYGFFVSAKLHREAQTTANVCHAAIFVGVRPDGIEFKSSSYELLACIGCERIASILPESVYAN